MLFVCLCTSLLWPECGKHLTGSLVLPFPAAAWMKVECISQAICSCTCVWKLEREKHLRITQSGFYNRTKLLTAVTNSIQPGDRVHCSTLFWQGYTFCHSWAFLRVCALFGGFQWIWALFGVLTNFTPMDPIKLLEKSTKLAHTKAHKFWGKQKSSRSGWENAICLSLLFLPHQQILHHLHHFLGHNLRCALTISQRLPRKQLPVSPRGFKRLRSKSSCGHCPGPNWSLSDARITCNPTRDESTYVAHQCPKSLDRLVVSVSTCAKNISHFGSTSQVPWKKSTTLNAETT